MELRDFKTDVRISQAHRAELRNFVSDLGKQIIDLADRLGLKVFGEDLPEEDSGYIEYAPSYGSESGYRVVVNSNHKAERQRFTVAHEIAHFVLHRDEPDFCLRRERGHRSRKRERYGSWRALQREREANGFATELLMPRHLVTRSFAFMVADIGALAVECGVSWDAAERRWMELNSLPKSAAA